MISVRSHLTGEPAPADQRAVVPPACMCPTALPLRPFGPAYGRLERGNWVP